MTASYVQAENVIFEKMASQGQSVFGAEGDTGLWRLPRIRPGRHRHHRQNASLTSPSQSLG